MFLGRSSISVKIRKLEAEINALEHLLKGGDSTTAREDIREFIPIYEGGNKDWLRSMLPGLLREKLVLLKENAALQKAKALVTSLDELDAVEKEIRAVKHLLKGGKSTTAPEGIREAVLMYEGGDKDRLISLLTALINSQAAVGRNGLEARRDPGFSPVWNAILHYPIVENPANSRLWSLHGGVRWFGGFNVLYNRPCYDEITQKISSPVTRALVLGTPGIGKTLYLQAFLVHLVRRAKEEGRDPPTIHYVHKKNKDSIQTLSFLPDGSVVDVSIVPGGPNPDYVLSDSVDLSYAYGNVLNLEVAADEVDMIESNHRSFQKRVMEAGNAGRQLVMPVFSFEELQSIQPADMDSLVAKFRYDVFGGSARNFIAVRKRSCTVLPVVDKTLTSMFPDVKKKNREAWDCVARQVSEELMKSALDDKRATTNSMMRHVPPGGSDMWASTFMERLATAIRDDRAPVRRK